MHKHVRHTFQNERRKETSVLRCIYSWLLEFHSSQCTCAPFLLLPHLVTNVPAVLVCVYNKIKSFSQVVDHIINTLARLLPPPTTEENDIQEEKPQFLSQLLSLLSSSGTLQRSLLLLVFHYLSLDNLTQEQVGDIYLVYLTFWHREGILCRLRAGFYSKITFTLQTCNSYLSFSCHFLLCSL